MKSKAGRKPLPKGKKKKQLYVFLEQERIDKAGGKVIASEKLQAAAEKIF